LGTYLLVPVSEFILLRVRSFPFLTHFKIAIHSSNNSNHDFHRSNDKMTMN
jgi:hypothetical protein